MESDGPVSAVQVRLAKGEITTTQYKEIMSHLMKNVSSFQQTSSLKIIQMRYAKSEITAAEYQESFTNLMRNLYSQPWSPPLHILHIRYAEGEIDSSQYEEMFANLTQEQFAYDQSTPLWILNNRYATGELSTPEYEEILSLFTEYTLSMQQSAMKVPDELQTQFQKNTNSDAVPPRKTSEPIPSPERSTLNLKTPPVKQAMGSDTLVLPREGSDSEDYDDFDDRPIRSSSTSIKSEPLPVQKSAEDIQIQYENSSEVLSHASESGDLESSSVSGESETLSKPAISSDLLSIPEMKAGSAIHAEMQSFPSTLSHVTSSRGSEALPSDFLSLGMKTGADSGSHAEATLAVSSGEQIQSESPMATTISSAIDTISDASSSSLSLVQEPELVSGENEEDGSKPEIPKEKSGTDTADIRQRIKTLIVKGNYQEAVELAESMIGEGDTDYLPHFYKGMARYYLNIHDIALSDLDHARELCKNKDEIRKIDTIRNHILCKQKKDAEGIECPVAEESRISPSEPESVTHEENTEDLSAKLDALGKKAQDLIDKKDYKSANKILSEFIEQCSGKDNEWLKSESVDEIYAALGYVKYQLKDYSHAKQCFQDALAINPENEVSNNYMKDILIRAVRKK